MRVYDIENILNFDRHFDDLPGINRLSRSKVDLTLQPNRRNRSPGFVAKLTMHSTFLGFLMARKNRRAARLGTEKLPCS